MKRATRTIPLLLIVLLLAVLYVGRKPPSDEVRFAKTLVTAVAQAKAGDMAGAQKTFDQARKAAAMVRDAFGKSQAYQGIADAQEKIGDKAGAEETRTLIQARVK